MSKEVYDRLVDFCPFYVTGPASWWYALLWHRYGDLPVWQGGQFRCSLILTRPLLFSADAIQRSRLNTDSPAFPVESAESATAVEEPEATEGTVPEVANDGQKTPAKEATDAPPKPPAGDAGKDSDSSDEEKPKPVAKSGRVTLYGRRDRPKIDGKEKGTLTKARYDVVKALIEAGTNGLTKDELDRKSQHGDSRKVMERLAKADSDWKSVLSLPGKTGEGYRIE